MNSLTAKAVGSFMVVTCPYCGWFSEKGDIKSNLHAAAEGEAKSKVIAHIKRDHKDVVTVED